MNKICKICEQEYSSPRENSQECSYKRSYLKVENWLAGRGTSEEASQANGELLPSYKKWLKVEAGNKCSICGWSMVNRATGKVPVHVDHIDGNWRNNQRDNLRVLCPNCHSITENFGSLNRDSPKDRPSNKGGSNRKRFDGS